MASPLPASDIIKHALLERKARNASYSLRAFARDLGVSHSYLSQVMAGRLPLSIKHAVRFSEYLDLEAGQSQALVREAAERPARRQNSASPEFFVLEIDRFKLFQEWYHFAILDLTLVEGFRPDLRWIAGRLGISPRQVRTAVNRLTRLGLLEKDGRRWRKVHRQIQVPTHEPVRAMAELHRQLIERALEALQSPRVADYEARDITGTMIPLNRKRLPEAKRRIARFRAKLLKFLSEGAPPDDLYQLNVQLFSLTRTRKRRKA